MRALVVAPLRLALAVIVAQYMGWKTKLRFVTVTVFAEMFPFSGIVAPEFMEAVFAVLKRTYAIIAFCMKSVC